MLGSVLPTGPTASIIVVFALIALSFYLFYREPVPLDIVAIIILVSTVLLEPWTKVSVEDGFAGFSNPAVLTILAMFILSEGVRRTGVLHRVTTFLFNLTGDDSDKQLLATLGFAGPVSGIINNTPIVAMMIPVLNNISEKSGFSPSRLLMPLSYAAIAGGLLTLIGSSSNLLASNISGRLIGQHFSMFEFTGLGAIVLLITIVYLVTVGKHLLPDHETSHFGQYEVNDYLTEVLIEKESAYEGHTVRRFVDETDPDFDVVALVRDGEKHFQPFTGLYIRKGDVLILRTGEDSLVELLQMEGLSLIPEKGEGYAAVEEHGGFTLTNIVVLPGSQLVGETLISSSFRKKYDASALAIRRSGENINSRLNSIRFRPGDTLLLQTSEEAMEDMAQDNDFAMSQGPERLDYNTEKMPWAITIIAGVVALAAAGILPIVVSAFAGVVAMILTGCLKPRHVYKAVNWQVIFILAGVIPLGIALESSGAASMIANGIASLGGFIPSIGVLAVVFIIANLLANTIDANAAVILMGPVAFHVASSIGANPFSFMIAIAFGVGTAFMSPIGYQTNMMVYGPGNYRFSDFVKVGGLLQLLLTVVIITGIALIWGV